MKKLQDERITALGQKISSEACAIVMGLLIVSILVQQLLLDAPFEQYLAECICFLTMAFYIVIRYVALGLNPHAEGKSAKATPLTTAITIGITTTARTAYVEYEGICLQKGWGIYIAVLAVGFIVATFASYAGISYIYYLSKNKQAKIEKQLDATERDE